MNQKGVLGLMVFLALMLPLATFLGQQNQENRGLAAGLNSSCVVPSGCGWDNCRGDCSGSSDIVCYGSSSRVCKVKSGGTCARSSDCYGNHYCSRTTHHCRKKDKKWIGDYSVEGISVSSMLGGSVPTTRPTTIPTIRPTTRPTTRPTIRPTTIPTVRPTTIPTPKPTIFPATETNLSFKLAFAGIVPGAECIDKYLVPETKLELSIVNVPSNNHQDNLLTSFEETNEVDSKGNRIFKVTSLVLDNSKFSSVDTFNYVKIKGPWHLKRKMCQDGQNSRLSETTVCEIDLKVGDVKVYDFSEYTLLAGDIDKNGVVNTIDLSFIKAVLSLESEIKCGIEGDLNMDGIVNTYDLNLVKDTLVERDSE